jgi:hypothetical protein
VFAARYALSPCIKQTCFVFKGLISCRGTSWTVWGFLQRQNFLFLTLTLQLNVNDASSKKNLILLFPLHPALNLWLRIFLLFCMLLHYAALWVQDILYRTFTDFFFAIMHALQSIANEYFCSEDYILQGPTDHQHCLINKRFFVTMA